MWRSKVTFNLDRQSIDVETDGGFPGPVCLYVELKEWQQVY